MKGGAGMTATERRAAVSLATIFSFRMLGLFMILPVFALYAHSLKGASATLVGLALGIYGLTQALMQIPLGMLSDRVGRKPVIVGGLLVFALGSVVAALSHSLTGIIIGRAIQGAGAIGSTTIAMVADLTSEAHRTKAMAIIGITIGVSFSVAMVLGPVLNAHIGVSGIFWLTAVMGIFGILILLMRVPTPERSVFHRDAEPVPELFKSILRNIELLRLNYGIAVLHAMLTAVFIAIPIALERSAGLMEAHQWRLYLPVLILSFVAMIPFIIIAEKRRKMKSIFLSAIIALAMSQVLLLFFHHALMSFGVALLIFFTAFTLLEASLPSLVSKVAPAGSKGTAMGVYSCSQFFGIFLGGTLGGWIYHHYAAPGIFLFCTILAFTWFAFAASMKKPSHLGTFMLKVGEMAQAQSEQLAARLRAVAGVGEVMISNKDGIAYLKIDNTIVDKKELIELYAATEG